jgi:hypothetical protein
MLILLIGKSRVSCKFLQAMNQQPRVNFPFIVDAFPEH